MKYKIIANSLNAATEEHIDTIESTADDVVAATKEFYRIRNILHDAKGLMKSTQATRYDLMILQKEDGDKEWSIFQAKRIFI